MTRTDVPMDGIHGVSRDLKDLASLLDGDRPLSIKIDISGPIPARFIRHIMLGIVANLDGAITEINNS